MSFDSHGKIHSALETSQNHTHIHTDPPPFYFVVFLIVLGMFINFTDDIRIEISKDDGKNDLLLFISASNRHVKHTVHSQIIPARFVNSSIVMRNSSKKKSARDNNMMWCDVKCICNWNSWETRLGNGEREEKNEMKR